MTNRADPDDKSRLLLIVEGKEDNTVLSASSCHRVPKSNAQTELVANTYQIVCEAKTI